MNFQNIIQGLSYLLDEQKRKLMEDLGSHFLSEGELVFSSEEELVEAIEEALNRVLSELLGISVDELDHAEARDTRKVVEEFVQGKFANAEDQEERSEGQRES
ncbi:hypothetical protein ACFL06_01300 [Patescibacteria group bacterium]